MFSYFLRTLSNSPSGRRPETHFEHSGVLGASFRVPSGSQFPYQMAVSIQTLLSRVSPGGGAPETDVPNTSEAPFEEQIQRRGRRQRQKCKNAWDDSPSFQAFSPGCSNMLILIRGVYQKTGIGNLLAHCLHVQGVLPVIAPICL